MWGFFIIIYWSINPFIKDIINIIINNGQRTINQNLSFHLNVIFETEETFSITKPKKVPIKRYFINRYNIFCG